MRICNNCQTHNLDHDHNCHTCGSSLTSQPILPWKTALLLGLVSTGCVDDKYGGEPEYGVAMMEIDMDDDGVFVFTARFGALFAPSVLCTNDNRLSR